ncbi:MAG: hypothetical protein H0W73_17350 [Bacteroidetes bacterium]|nr:hypothetical protein [Bacteroidota bacterium]
MKKIILVLMLVTLFNKGMQSQEKYGRTLNLGAGIGYYGYSPAISLNYEFDVFKNFTLAPFVTVMSHRHYRYWGDVNKNYPYKNYYYRETIVPIGVKGTYYFDELLNATETWDFYAAASLGVAYRTTTWDSDYYGDRVVRSYSSPLYGDLHIGAEAHLSSKVGLFLDLSTGLSTLGLGFHF